METTNNTGADQAPNPVKKTGKSLFQTISSEVNDETGESTIVSALQTSRGCIVKTTSVFASKMEGKAVPEPNVTYYHPVETTVFIPGQTFATDAEGNLILE